MLDRPVLRIFGIHTESLTLRGDRLHGVMQALRMAAIGAGYHVIPRLIIKPDVGKITENLKDYGDKVNYEPCGDGDFDSQRQVFSTEMLSNFEKHREAWRRISEVESVGEKDMFLIVEDDSYLLPEGLEGWKHVLATAASQQWDMIHLGIAQLDSKADYVPLNKIVKVLPSKDAYLITQQAAKRLYEQLTDKYRFVLRVQLSWFVHQHKDFQLMCPNRRVLIDGSKLGICPSSIHVNNVLVFNNEYMTLFKLYNSPRLTKEMKAVQNAYKIIEHLGCPEAVVLMGKIEEKLGNVGAAKMYLEKGVAAMKGGQGIINGRSELITTLIKLYGKHQADVDECSKMISKYSTLL